MSDFCYYTLTAVGPVEGIEELERRMRKGQGPWYLPRVGSCSECFLCDTSRDADIVLDGEHIAFRSYDGDVANALSVTMCDDEMVVSPFANPRGGRTTLSQCARDLDLDIEVYGEGSGFVEHYRYEAATGIALAEECRELGSFYWDPEAYETFEDFIEGEGLPSDLCRDGLCPGDFVDVGGYESALPTISVSDWVLCHASRYDDAGSWVDRISLGEPLVDDATGATVWQGTLGVLLPDEVDVLGELMSASSTWRHARVSEQYSALSLSHVDGYCPRGRGMGSTRAATS